MKQPRSNPDKLLADGNNKARKLAKSFKVLNLNRVTNKTQITIMVKTTIKSTDFCSEKNIINGQNKLNSVVTIIYE
jgi:hypothetical protein